MGSVWDSNGRDDYIMGKLGGVQPWTETSSCDFATFVVQVGVDIRIPSI